MAHGYKCKELLTGRTNLDLEFREVGQWREYFVSGDEYDVRSLRPCVLDWTETGLMMMMMMMMMIQ